MEGSGRYYIDAEATADGQSLSAANLASVPSSRPRQALDSMKARVRTISDQAARAQAVQGGGTAAAGTGRSAPAMPPAPSQLTDRSSAAAAAAMAAAAAQQRPAAALGW